MVRTLRITFPGVFYHVTSRGNERKAVFKSRCDRDKFLEYFSAKKPDKEMLAIKELVKKTSIQDV